MTAPHLPFPQTAAQAADRIIDLLLNDEEGMYGIPEADLQTLLALAGDKLAEKFVFAYCAIDEGFPCWIITPKQYWDDEGCVMDQPSPIDHLMPEDSEDMNESGTWAIFEDDMPPLARAQDLMARGFQWDRDFQAFIDSETLAAATLTKHLAAQSNNDPQTGGPKNGM